MKTPVSTVREIIVPFFAVLGLIANLSGCSTPAPRHTVQAQPVSQPPASAETQQPQATQKIRVKENHPVHYVVKKGDTLWDIASLFLKDPWYWPEIWQRNPQIKNPHLIYPGDVLTLIYVNGQPQIVVNQTTSQSGPQAVENNLPVKKLSPTIRTSKIDTNIPSIPGDAIRQFLTRPRVVTKEQLDKAPYVLGSDDDHLILGQGNEVYVRGELDKERVRYTVFRPGDKLIDPKTGDLLGYEAIYAGEVRIKKYGDPATGVLVSTSREVLIGDRLLPADKSSQNNLYFPKLPDREVHGQIISLFDALFGVAKYQIAVVNLGASDGIEVGNLLATFYRGDTLRDDYDPTDKGRMVKMPNERSGLMMIFRAFDKVSYGLVMESTNVIHKGDLVATPK
jgi:hypothetical protein